MGTPVFAPVTCIQRESGFPTDDRNSTDRSNNGNGFSSDGSFVMAAMAQFLEVSNSVGLGFGAWCMELGRKRLSSSCQRTLCQEPAVGGGNPAPYFTYSLYPKHHTLRMKVKDDARFAACTPQDSPEEPFYEGIGLGNEPCEHKFGSKTYWKALV